MITLEQFSETVGGCDIATFEIIRVRAKQKLSVIIDRFGDESGARLTDKYLLRLMVEELRAQRLSFALFSVFTHSAAEKERPIIA